MMEKLITAYCRGKLAMINAFERVENFSKEEKGASDIVAIVVIIVIILAVAVIFREALVKGVQNVMNKFTEFVG